MNSRDIAWNKEEEEFFLCTSMNLCSDEHVSNLLCEFYRVGEDDQGAEGDVAREERGYDVFLVYLCALRVVSAHI